MNIKTWQEESLQMPEAVPVVSLNTIRLMNREINELRAERNFAVKAMDRMQTERDALALDAARYRWLVKNHKAWSWNPSQFNPEIVSGFAAHGTGYLGHTFQDAIAAAMKGASK